MEHLRKTAAAGWLPVLSVLLTCFFPCVFLYAHNVDEAPFTSMFPFFGVFALNGLIFLIIFGLLLRNFARAAVMTNLSMLVVINFGMCLSGLQKLISSLTPLALMIAFGAVLLVILGLLLWKKPDLKILCGLFSLAFGALIAVNFVTAGIFNLQAQDPPDSGEAFETYEPMTFSGDKPNVYFFLFDGYGGAENLQHYYNYDNEPFLTAMEDRGFTVSRDSHNTESLKTVTIVPNLMNMNYVIEGSMTTAQRNAFLEMPNLFRTFRDNGYQLNLINHLDYFGATGCNVLTEKQSRRTISDFLLTNSLYDQFDFIKKELNSLIHADYVATYTGPLFNAMDAEMECWQHVGEGPTFTMGYVQCPHAPTILDKDGNLVENYESVGWKWDRHELYLGQLEFVSSFILELVEKIQEHDPNALIFVQSDHGSRQANHYYDMGIKGWETFDAPTENLYMQNILNCVYYRGETFPIGGLTGINTIRTVLNQVFGTDYEMIEPYYYQHGRFEH